MFGHAQETLARRHLGDFVRLPSQLPLDHITHRIVGMAAFNHARDPAPMDCVANVERGFARHNTCLRRVHHIHAHDGRDAEIERLQQNVVLFQWRDRLFLEQEIFRLGFGFRALRDTPCLSEFRPGQCASPDYIRRNDHRRPRGLLTRNAWSPPSRPWLTRHAAPGFAA